MDSQSAVILKPVFVPARLPQNHELCDKFCEICKFYENLCFFYLKNPMQIEAQTHSLLHLSHNHAFSHITKVRMMTE